MLPHPVDRFIDFEIYLSRFLGRCCAVSFGVFFVNFLKKDILRFLTACFEYFTGHSIAFGFLPIFSIFADKLVTFFVAKKMCLFYVSLMFIDTKLLKASYLITF